MDTSKEFLDLFMNCRRN